MAEIFTPAWPVKQTPQQIIQTWISLRDEMDRAKAAEMLARKAVIEAVGFDSAKKEGTEYVELANGWKLKTVKKQNYSLDNKDDATDRALTELEATGSNGAFVAERLIKWAPTISISEYRKLSPEHKAIIDKVLTVTDGAPSLELIEPKGK